MFAYGLNYTWSKALGVAGTNWNGTAVNPLNYRDNYGPESFDHTNIFNATYSYANILDRILFKQFSGVLGGVVNNWMISGITSYQSGSDLTALNNPDYSIIGELNVQNTDGSAATLPVQNTALLGTPDVHLMPRLTCNPAGGGGSHHYVNNACFALPTQVGVNGPYQEPYVHGPGYLDSDLALQKQFNLGSEARNIQVRYSAFNFLNHANTTFDTSVNPSALILSYSNGAAAQQVSDALSTAANSNASTFGYAPQRVGRRVTEVQVKFNF
jgi:hypothetical protein